MMGCVANRNFLASSTLSSGTLVNCPVIVTRPQGGFSAVVSRQPPEVPLSNAISDQVIVTFAFFIKSWYVTSKDGIKVYTTPVLCSEPSPSAMLMMPPKGAGPSW